MSNLQLYINNFLISSSDIIKWPSLTEEISYDSNFNIPDKYDIELTNANPHKYDPKYSGSLFYGTKIMKIPVYIYDPDVSAIIMRGIIQNISTDNEKITISCTSQLSAISDNDIEIIETGKTPAEIVYKILTSPITKGSTIPLIDPSYIDHASYRFSSNYQRANKCTANITVYKGDDGKKIGDIIPELNKIGHMYLYSHYDRIYFWQYTGDQTPSFIVDKIKANSYRDYYCQDEAFKVKNSYNVAYYNGANIARVTGKDDDSIEKYGEFIFGIPSDDIDSDSSADMCVGIDNILGAKWCGKTAIERLYKPSLMAEFEIEYKYKFLKVGDIIGLNFGVFTGYNTPVRLLTMDYDRDGDVIGIKVLFL